MQQLDVLRSCQWGDQLKQLTNGAKNAIVHASTVLAQPAEMYNQLYELVRVESKISITLRLGSTYVEVFDETLRCKVKNLRKCSQGQG